MGLLQRRFDLRRAGPARPSRRRNLLVFLVVDALLVGAAIWLHRDDAPRLTGAAVPPGYAIAGRCAAIDGDTCAIGETRIRLWGIDAPESGTPAGEAARARLRVLARQDWRCVAAGDRADRYGRLLAACTDAGGRDVAALLVEEGLARAMTRFTDRYAAAEARARAAERGIWAQPAMPSAP